MESLLWLIFEAGVALGALLFIVWWTWPRGKRGESDAGSRPQGERTDRR